MGSMYNNNNFMYRIAAFVVDKRNLFFLLYGFAIICPISEMAIQMKINSEI